MKRLGSADLPLHYGKVPAWLYNRMEKLGTAIVEIILTEYGRDELLRRLSDPFWFQALGSVMGMDWHSSGITTSVMGALKRGINKNFKEFGIYICGGRGKHSRKTPEEITYYSDKAGLDSKNLIKYSRLCAKIDNSCILDGFNIYMHFFVLTKDGKWSIIQQGMNEYLKKARRYHWLGENVTDFFSDPRSAIEGENVGRIINLSDAKAIEARNSILDFFKYPVSTQLKEIKKLVMASNHDIPISSINEKRLAAVLSVAYDKQFKDFTDAILTNGIGPRTVMALSLVSEVIYGERTRFEDPARFSFALGGKDGYPYPVPLKAYDETINFLHKSIIKSKTESEYKNFALKKLNKLYRYVESNFSPAADIKSYINWERDNSEYMFNGKYIGVPHYKKNKSTDNNTKNCIQLSLFD